MNKSRFFFWILISLVLLVNLLAIVGFALELKFNVDDPISYIQCDNEYWIKEIYNLTDNFFKLTVFNLLMMVVLSILFLKQKK